MLPDEQPVSPAALDPVPEAAGGISSVRDVAAGPAGPVRIEVRLIPSAPLTIARHQLSVTGPGIPQVRIDRVETTREQARREKAEAKMAATGKRPRTAARPGRNPLEQMLRLPDLFPRVQGAARLNVAGSAAELRPRRAVMVRASYGVGAQVSGRRYALTQVWWRTARVKRDGQQVAGLQRRSSYQNGRYADDVEWAAGADPLDVAMTHALASGYRVGSPGFLANLALVILGLLSMY